MRKEELFNAEIDKYFGDNKIENILGLKYEEKINSK